MFKAFLINLIILSLLGSAAMAEDATYGAVDLMGLAKRSWSYNSGNNNAMVCNVNGPDGYVSIRSGPGTEYKAKRNLKRLAIVEVDTTQRRGNWVKVLTAYRTHTINGKHQKLKSLHVSGWVHDGYLCDFIA